MGFIVDDEVAIIWMIHWLVKKWELYYCARYTRDELSIELNAINRDDAGAIMGYIIVAKAI